MKNIFLYIVFIISLFCFDTVNSQSIIPVHSNSNLLKQKDIQNKQKTLGVDKVEDYFFPPSGEITIGVIDKNNNFVEGIYTKKIDYCMEENNYEFDERSYYLNNIVADTKRYIKIENNKVYEISSETNSKLGTFLNSQKILLLKIPSFKNNSWINKTSNGEIRKYTVKSQELEKKGKKHKAILLSETIIWSKGKTNTYIYYYLKGIGYYKTTTVQGKTIQKVMDEN